MAGWVLVMRGSERDRAFLARQAVDGLVNQREASEHLGVSVRQFKRLVRAWRFDGDASLVSRQRGRPSHRRMSEALRTRIGGLLKEKYADFGPTLATEKLLGLDGIKMSVEMVRRIQMDLASGGRRRGARGGCSSCARGDRGSAN
jgi:transposase